MSTSIDNPGLPDISALEKLANQFFRSIDSGSVQGVEALAPSASPPSPSGYDSLFSQGNGFDVAPPATPPSVPSTPYGSAVAAPPSAVGVGISPSVLQNESLNNNNVDAKYVTAPQYHSDHGGRIPASVAGSGASPSAGVQHGNNIDIHNPQIIFKMYSFIKQCFQRLITA